MSNKQLLLCYNRGCGQQYDPDKNTETSCRFHPGTPFFHETYKGWSCCNKKSTDFTEFLNIKGCQVAAHSNEKPPEEKKEEVKNDVVPDPIPAPVSAPKPRPPADSPLIPLPRSVATSLEKTLSELKDKLEVEDEIKKDDGVIAVGTPCYNAGCKGSYDGPESLKSTCRYHTGVPIFHEGMKYWSCCQRKTSDFDTFLEQEGCEEGKHLWKKPKKTTTDEQDKKTSCRMDWHQTSDDVVISVFSKVPIPSLCVVEANAVKIRIAITFGQDRKEYENELILYGVINVEKSKLCFMNSKVEISLRKAEPGSWANLFLHPVNSSLLES